MQLIEISQIGNLRLLDKTEGRRGGRTGQLEPLLRFQPWAESRWPVWDDHITSRRSAPIRSTAPEQCEASRAHVIAATDDPERRV